jgi:GntR family transcriptional repressor for pyruvate dehydrogenase complex
MQAKPLVASTCVRRKFMARVQSTRFVFQPVMLVRPAEVVAFRITEAIRAGDVRIGEKLPSEQGLSQQLGISRPTLREAIKLLVHAGIVEVQPGSSGGIFITSEAIPAELCGYPMPELPLQDMDNVLEARRLFEPHVARLAAMYATSADFERMREAVELSEQTSSRFRNKRLTDEGARLMTLASTRFNIAVGRATQNVMVVQMMEVMLRHMEMVRMLAVRELSDFSLSTQSLRNSLLAIESGNPHQIDAATSERIGLLESAWELAAGKRLRRRPVLKASTSLDAPLSRRLRNKSSPLLKKMP